MTRMMSVSGSFYPESKEEIESYLKYFNKVFEKHFSLTEALTRAVIVPHAGYIYSGFTANIAYRILKNSNIKRFVLFGPSHRIGFEGMSLCEYEEYATPFGALKSDQEILNSLQKEFKINCLPQAHHEHSTEVQFPFLKYYIPDATVVEIVYSSIDSHSVSAVIDFLLDQDDIGIIISTDLSHFYSLQEANLRDQICINAIENLNLEKLDEGCEACGMTGVKAMLMCAKKRSMKPHIIDYRTSADVSNDTQSVVGYVSAYFT